MLLLSRSVLLSWQTRMRATGVLRSSACVRSLTLPSRTPVLILTRKRHSKQSCDRVSRAEEKEGRNFSTTRGSKMKGKRTADLCPCHHSSDSLCDRRDSSAASALSVRRAKVTLTPWISLSRRNTLGTDTRSSSSSSRSNAAGVCVCHMEVEDGLWKKGCTVHSLYLTQTSERSSKRSRQPEQRRRQQRLQSHRLIHM